MAQGMPGMRGIDHVGFTVPDLDEAERFLVDVLGAEPIYTLGAKQSDDSP
jgi:catechol 2,3-dioxygenase-like lactoylglutathione lyase family enzyme